jgi:hypothetical protein
MISVGPTPEDAMLTATSLTFLGASPKPSLSSCDAAFVVAMSWIWRGVSALC